MICIVSWNSSKLELSNSIIPSKLRRYKSITAKEMIFNVNFSLSLNFGLS